MKHFLLLLCLCLSTLCAETKPNVVIFYLDDMGWAQPGSYGGKLAPTPHLDALAASGVRFTNGYSSGCICSPGRVGLLTGRYQARTGQDANCVRPGNELLLSEKTLAQHLKPAGYTTAIIGKWHLGATTAEYLPPARGFDHAHGTVGNLGEGNGPSYYEGDQLVKEYAGAPITSPLYAKEACDFLTRHQTKPTPSPFLLYLSFNAVHSPVVASAEWLKKFAHLDKREQAYAALIAEADEAVGTVMQKLRDLKLEEQTLIFCISDNGGASPLAEMNGLRGRKWFVWEGGIRVSWFASWKGRIPAGRVSDSPVIQLDVLPTALAAAGLPAPDVTLDGINLLPYLTGQAEQLPVRQLYWRFGPQYAVREGDWKLVKAAKSMQPMLVNLAKDPGEQTDLSMEQPEKKAQLQALYDQWNSTMLPARWEDKRADGDPERKMKKKAKKVR